MAGAMSSLNSEKNKSEDLAVILSHLPHMIGQWDENLINVYCNNAYSDYFGKKPYEIKGLHLKELLGPVLYEKNRIYAEAALRGETQLFERIIPLPNGGSRETLAHYIPNIVDGINKGFFVIVTDISELKKAELDRQKMEAHLVAASKMASLGEMAAGLAHEINNPLSIIYGDTCMLTRLSSKKNIEPTDILKIKNLASEIEETCLRIEKIIDGLRMFSRDDSKDGFESITISKVIEQTLSLCEQRFRNQGIDLRVEKIDPQLKIKSRPTQISQIILNLLNNAYDAVSQSQNPWIEIDVSSKEKIIQISIQNGGPQIPPNIQERMFEPFYTTKPTGQGTGLGLSISYGLANANHGQLYFDKSSKNTRFILELPECV